jgi:putative RNA 2'-phosphotransferase
MAERSSIPRFEFRVGRIRARYGHTIRLTPDVQTVQPPDYLFHGTSTRALNSIRRVGLVPMERHYVHLAAEPRYSKLIQQTHGSTGILLRVRARESAVESTVRFWRTCEVVWISDPVPQRFIDLVVRGGPESQMVAVPLLSLEPAEEKGAICPALSDVFASE